jgi:hypothetical protein
MAGSSDNGGRSSGSSKNGKAPPPWRAPFDAVERPVTSASQSWLQSNLFMDGLAIAWRVQRRVNVDLRRGLGICFEVLNMPTRGDVDRLSNQLANVERQLRELRSGLEASEQEQPEPQGLPIGTGAVRRRPASRDRR